VVLRLKPPISIATTWRHLGGSKQKQLSFHGSIENGKKILLMVQKSQTTIVWMYKTL